MYFEDLTLLSYHPGPLDASSWRVPLLAIGWLEEPYPFMHGVTPNDFSTKLQRMVERAKESHPHQNFRGLHRCSLCKAEGVENALPNSFVNLIVPGESVIYGVPAGITHYIGYHSYKPPAAFVAAVEACQEYGSG